MTTRSYLNVFASVFFFSLWFLLSGCNSTSENNQEDSQKNDQENAEWFNEQVWISPSIKPHSSINAEEFKTQYSKNSKYWDEAFKYMKENDLSSLAPGNFVIDSGNVFGFVALTSPKEKDSVQWEAHRNFNDLQYVISGKAGMGVAPISDPNAVVTTPYNKSDNENFSLGDGGNYYVGDSSVFFIFSPEEIHRPAFKEEGYDTIKKIVIKVRVP